MSFQKRRLLQGRQGRRRRFRRFYDLFHLCSPRQGEGRRPMTGRRSRPSRSPSRSFPVTGSLKIKTGHIVLVMSGWRYCGLMSLEQSDPSKICAKILGVKGIVVVRSMSPASARHHSPKEQGFKAGQQASLDESISVVLRLMHKLVLILRWLWDCLIYARMCADRTKKRRGRILRKREKQGNGTVDRVQELLQKTHAAFLNRNFVQDIGGKRRDFLVLL
ncbi:uncharacterized protein LOC125555918 isoform X3 [Triticum urartu]|uniref:uncharacterized protein LOC125555918 isoform X3 n=1 Tax=Triticum urartu TaxID=4572 RepID=UPI00204335CB|nr:uncharacterized protein LOC125555918 isoform X3 [Triticum urartu]XP_048574804.1 uncharacterized protein LOC125555918 isoform X3 [Triticum urartu]XP_048574812.1 uncharacterized protein LOC125555918 isoform X3 [Triticum urartu]XP_048574818.1 uncharacterized protein LOC125555918 isoform X3 [Triticum urartu]